MNNVSPNSALSLKKQSSYSVAHKRQSSIQFTHKKQFSHPVIHKGQSSIQSVCKKQLSHFIIHKKQFSNSVILKKSSSIPAALKKLFNFISLIMELNISSCIAQAIQRGYQSKIEYQSSLFLQISHRFSIQLNVAELKAQNFNQISHFKNVEVFSLILHEINFYLNLISSPFLQSSFRILNFYQKKRFLSIHENNKVKSYEKDHYLILQQMEKELHLTVIII